MTGAAPNRGARAARWRFGGDLEPLEDLLAAGGVLAIPTESSYGLGVDPRSVAGVAAVYGLKRRERGKALPVVAADLGQILALGVAPDAPGLEWASARWPAPLSLIVPLAAPLPACGDERTLAVRVPGDERLRRLLGAIGRPLTATSANPAGGEPYLDPDEVASWLAGTNAIVVDGGRLVGGPPSTLVRFGPAGPEVLRPGRFEIR